MAGDRVVSAEQVLSFLANEPSDYPAPKAPGDIVQAYREAAAVLVAVQDPEQLRPVGAKSARSGVADILRPDLVPATGARFIGTVMLDPVVRAATLRGLASSGRVREALDANRTQRTGPLQAQFEKYLLGDPPPLDGQSLAQLDDTRQVAAWLEGVVDGVPSEELVQRRAAYLRLIEPFETIAGDNVFRGRKKELDDLRTYVGVRPPESVLRRVSKALFRWAEPDKQPAVSIYGPGGVGKSALVARFMLEHTRLSEDERVPFAYLDFNRTALDVGDPFGLAREMVSQLAIQFPVGGRFEPLVRFVDTKASAAPASPYGIGAAESVLADLLGIMGAALGPRPYVVVLDTFENVQYRGEVRAYPLWDMLIALQERYKFLRVVVSGRAPVDSLRLAGKSPFHIELAALDDDAAKAFLATQGVTDPVVQARLVRTFGGIPLSLKLVAALASKEPTAEGDLLTAPDGQSILTMSDELIQGQLFGRILNRIANEQVRRVASPGLVLRRVNPELILEVLNGPCQLGLTSIEEAQQVFDELKRETSLVSLDVDGDLVHRQDLRQVMLKLLVASAPGQVAEIRRTAIDWYRRQPGRRGKAEELYHRLHLGEWIDQRELLDREVRSSVQAALVEFPLSVQRRLATLGFEVPADVLEQATAQERDASLAAQIEELLPYGPRSEQEAWSMIERAGKDLKGPSPLYRAGARIAAQRGDDAVAGDLIERGLEAAVGGGETEQILGLLQERAWLHRDRPLEDQAAGLQQLEDHALRLRDRVALLQHRAQSINPADEQIARRLIALGGLITHAEPEEVWGLVPALRLPVEAAAERRLRALLSPLQAIVTAGSSPFRYSVFAERRAQTALERLQVIGPDAAPQEFGFAFVLLAQVWPYRVLFVSPPYGRLGEQLSESLS